ncbi:MAG: chorismate mutase [Clostridiaceae bacterium]|nr:chorismate mutase [Clostridiaceae bacterium]
MTVRAVRGATTVHTNTTDDIIKETTILLKNIVDYNNLNEEDIISIIFTVTNDINAAFPAKAAREIGFTKVALMCMKEMEVPGSLEKCIRILIHVNTDKSNDEIRHVYLNNAKILRPDLME